MTTEDFKKLCTLHISGLLKLETSHHNELDAETFELILARVAKDCRFRVDMVTYTIGDSSLIGSLPLVCQLTGAKSRGDKDALIERLTRLFTPKGYDVDVRIID